MLPVDRWYQAIPFRHSVRRFSGQRVASVTLDRLEEVVREFRPFPGARAVLVRDPQEDVFKGLIGSYLKVVDAPHYIAFVGDMRVPHVQESVGYMGEGIILEATALNLNTCWVAGFLRRDRVRRHLSMEPYEAILSITPVGHALRESESVRYWKTVQNVQHRRRELRELLTTEMSSVPTWAICALEAARLAPSAVNRQPLQFSVTTDSIKISHGRVMTDFGVSVRLDCGIAMLHVELGAMNCNVVGEWKILQSPDVAIFTTRGTQQTPIERERC